MDREVWTARWRDGRIAFHQADVNQYLVRHADRFPSSGRVLVPLCGKSRDMSWLRARGLEVVGVEFVEDGARAFFEEQSIPYRQEGKRFAGDGIEIWVEDFFAVGAAELGTFDWIFDRGAMVAIPVEDEARYAAHLRSLLSPGGSIFLISIFYDRTKGSGPPFAISRDEIEELYRGHQVELMEENQVASDRGLEWLLEQAWRITARTPLV